MDLSAVSFCDSSGLRLIFGLHKKLTDAGGRFVIHDPSPQVRKVVNMVDPRAAVSITAGARWPADPSRAHEVQEH